MLENEMRVDDPDVELASSLRGQSAIASAKLAYRDFSGLFGSERFRKLAGLGAQKQRLLWASTSTKNAKYSDVKYVEPLIGRETINTLPLETLNAYRDHGQPKLTLTKNVARSQKCTVNLKQLGFDLEKIAGRLEQEGVGKFNKSYDLLLTAIRQKASEASVKGVA